MLVSPHIVAINILVLYCHGVGLPCRGGPHQYTLIMMFDDHIE